MLILSCLPQWLRLSDLLLLQYRSLVAWWGFFPWVCNSFSV